MLSYLSTIDDFIKEQSGSTQEPIQQTTGQQSLLDNPLWLEDMLSGKPDINFGHQPPPPDPPAPEHKPFIRKKAGRKPNPATPALRKAQNRAAQRAFRERKERHVENLETTIRNLREQLKELKQIKKKLEVTTVESWYLKGIVMTLQLVCMNHHINIPTHAPYLSDQDLHQMTNLDVFAIQAYLDAENRNNEALKSFFTKSQKKHPEQQQQPQPQESLPIVNDEEPDWINKIDESEMDKITSDAPIPHLREEELPDPRTSSLDGIHYIQLKLSVKTFIRDNSTLTNMAASRLRPSVLQMAVPHDPRIDLIPTQHMRDRMILFRDQMDYDRCFGLIINGATYCGGDPTTSDSWQLPIDFYREFWFLALNYKVDKMDKSRSLIVTPETRTDCPYIEEQIVKRNSNRARLINSGSYNPVTNDIAALYGGTNIDWNQKAVSNIMQNIPNLYPMYQDPLQITSTEEDEDSSSFGKIRHFYYS